MIDPPSMSVTPLESFPPVSEWDDWVGYDPAVWPRKVERRYMLVPTTCFNCEAACGLVAYIDKQTMRVQKLEGNPHHPGSRGRNCAKGPATLNQIEDPGRILYPLKRVGPRGSGKFERTTWDHALDSLAAPIRAAIIENRKTEVMYHVGRPGHDGYMDRVLQAWGVDGHNSHTNVCSSAARVGYATWMGADRPSPDHANAKFILLLSSHLETGHYFNPHAQRIIDAKSAGAKLCAIDVRLSNTASLADYWLAPWPGTEAFLLLAMANVILREGLYDRSFVETWTNWRDVLGTPPLRGGASGTPPLRGGPESATESRGTQDFDSFIRFLLQHYAPYTPEAAAKECDVAADKIVAVAREIGAAGSRFAAHVWRNAAAGNLGGWQVSRCLMFLSVLVGAVGTPGGTNPNTRDKFVPPPFLKPPPQQVWSELLYPREYPLAYHELSYLLPHFLTEGRGKISAYFTRVYNPVWTNPDGMMWERVLRDEKLIGVHAAITPMWSETAQYADFVLPTGLGPERHDLMSQETHAAQWLSFRQPVLRTARERLGERFEYTHQANPGEVWEEDEFWIALSWRIDPDGSLGVRRYFESPYRPGKPISVDEYYGWIFENSVPGLPAEAAKHNLSPLAYMRRYGAFLVNEDTYEGHMEHVPAKDLEGAATEPTGDVTKNGKTIGIFAAGKPRAGFKTPSKRLEIYSQTLADWGWPEYTMPAYIRSHVHRSQFDPGKGEYALVPTFRLPTLVHTRSANSKWLYELSNSNPVWMAPVDAARVGVELGGLVRITTAIGHFVNKVWITEGMRPGVVACSHHLGRWRLFDDVGTDKWASAKVVREEVAPGRFRFRRVEGIRPFESSDPDSRRVWWTDGGVHQNLTFPVHPDPVSGMHCWHQAVRVEPARPGDQYGDVEADTTRSMEVYREWLALTRPGPGPGGLRRPLWLGRAVRPADEAYRIG